MRVEMNPSLDLKIVREAYERDPAAAGSEYGAEFRLDVESFVPREIVEACVAQGCFEIPPADGTRYFAFVDPSGGSSDSMTLAVAHRFEQKAILDCLRERRPPFSPDDVVGDFCKLLAAYHVTQVGGDRYAGEWPRERFRVHGVEYKPAEHTRSELYLELLPLLNSQRVQLLDNPRLIAQLTSLERSPSRSGRENVDHPPGSHDDIGNATAGAVVAAISKKGVTPWRPELLSLDPSKDKLRKIDGPERIWRRLS